MLGTGNISVPHVLQVYTLSRVTVVRCYLSHEVKAQNTVSIILTKKQEHCQLVAAIAHGYSCGLFTFTCVSSADSVCAAHAIMMERLKICTIRVERLRLLLLQTVKGVKTIATCLPNQLVAEACAHPTPESDDTWNW